MQQQNKYSAIRVFYSYAHEDEPFRKQLEVHLSLLRRQGLISEWHDRQVLPGAERAKEIDTHLETASVILLLISSHFLASNYCYDIEMQRALERHRYNAAYVIPILISPCDWETAPFAHLQCLPRNGKPITSWNNRDEAFLLIVQDLRQIIEQLVKARWEMYNRLLDQSTRLCCVCHREGEQIHHIDGDSLNIQIGNLAVLCKTCLVDVEEGRITAAQLRLYMATLYADLKYERAQLDNVQHSFLYGPHGVRDLGPGEALENFSSLAKEIVQFIQTHRDDFSKPSDDQVQHILDLYQAISKVERAGRQFTTGIVKVIDKLPYVVKAQFTRKFVEHIRRFGQLLAIVNLDLLDIYSPGLAQELYNLIGQDIDLFLYIAYHCGRIDSKEHSYKDMILGLFAEHFSGDGFWELELHATSRLKWGDENLKEFQPAIQTSLTIIGECKEMLRQLIQEHWNLNHFIR